MTEGTAAASPSSRGDLGVLALDEVSREDASLVGNKAAILGELLKSGFTVPPGYVLTTSAFGRFLTENGLARGAGVRSNQQTRIPSALESAVSTVVQGLGAGLLAVRSSSTNEDLKAASFAGQYQTVLGVSGRAELEDALKSCWLSMFGKGAIQYTADHDAPGRGGAMAVLIQKLVRADSAGVAFSVNPVNGKKEVVVNAIRGLGDRLVSGTATPDHWVVDDKANCVSNAENAITKEEAVSIAELARKVESHFKTPQDIEWAISGGRLYLLQARPVTTLGAQQVPGDRKIEPVPIPIVIPDGYWTLDNLHYPQPMSPIFASYFLEMTGGLARQLVQDVGLPFDRFDFKLIGGRMYFRVVPPGGKDRNPPPAWLMGLLVRTVPSIRSKVKKMEETVRTDVAGRYVASWREEWMPEMVKRRNEFAAVDMKAMSDEELIHHLERVMAYVRRGKEIHSYLVLPLFAIGEFGDLCKQHLGWTPQRMLDLLGGLSERDSEPSRRLAVLVERARGDPSLAAAIKRSLKSEKIEEALSSDSSFSKDFQGYMDEFGTAILGYDVINPTLAEMPLELLRLVDAQMDSGHDPSETSSKLEKLRASGEAEIDKSDLPSDVKSNLRATLHRARLVYALHNEETYYTQHLPDGATRYALLEVGRRLSAEGVIEQRDDVFMLTLDEARGALEKGGDHKDLVRKRLGERAWAMKNPAPGSYGKAPPPPPSLSVFPPDARKLLGGFMWALGGMGAGESPSGAGELAGTPASPGKYEGTVRVVRDETEFNKIHPGDVMVCVCTSPSWSVVFSSLGALVTEAGGVLSHPAILAREYGIPAVLSVNGVTSKLKDGQRVKIDGDTGVIVMAE